jgi:hypothetical protein
MTGGYIGMEFSGRITCAALNGGHIKPVENSTLDENGPIFMGWKTH